jgi:hypothetical protein
MEKLVLFVYNKRMTNENFNIQNGLVGMNKHVLLKIMLISLTDKITQYKFNISLEELKDPATNFVKRVKGFFLNRG